MAGIMHKSDADLIGQLCERCGDPILEGEAFCAASDRAGIDFERLSHFTCEAEWIVAHRTA